MCYVAQGADGHYQNIKADRIPLGNKQDTPLTFFFREKDTRASSVPDLKYQTRSSMIFVLLVMTGAFTTKMLLVL